MLVDVVLMRHLGVKLSVAAIRTAMPVRGVLEVSQQAAHLRSPENPFGGGGLPTLFCVRLMTIRDSHLVIHGLESCDNFRAFDAATAWPQAWWCQRASGSRPRPSQVIAPIPAERVVVVCEDGER